MEHDTITLKSEMNQKVVHIRLRLKGECKPQFLRNFSDIKFLSDLT